MPLRDYVPYVTNWRSAVRAWNTIDREFPQLTGAIRDEVRTQWGRIQKLAGLGYIVLSRTMPVSRRMPGTALYDYNSHNDYNPSRKRGRFDSGNSSASADFLGNMSVAGATGSNVLSQYQNVDHCWKARKESRRHRNSRYRAYALKEKQLNAETKVQKFIRISKIFTIETGIGDQRMIALHSLGSISGTSATELEDEMSDIYAAMDQPDATGSNWPAAGTYSSYNMHIHRMSQRVEFTNTGSNPAYMDLYWCVCKKDPNFPTPDSLISSGATAKWAASTTADLGLTGVTLGVRGSALGLSPFDYNLVVENVKILKKDQVMLAASQSMEMSYGGDPYTLDTAKFDSIADGEQFGISGHTYFLIVVASGRVNATQKAEPVLVNALCTNSYSIKPHFTPVGTGVRTAQYIA